VSFVHGHAREAGWVVAHVRRPNLPEAGQLPLLPETLLTVGSVRRSRCSDSAIEVRGKYLVTPGAELRIEPTPYRLQGGSSVSSASIRAKVDVPADLPLRRGDCAR
jgi:hypothetical protein